MGTSNPCTYFMSLVHIQYINLKDFLPDGFVGLSNGPPDPAERCITANAARCTFSVCITLGHLFPKRKKNERAYPSWVIQHCLPVCLRCAVPLAPVRTYIFCALVSAHSGNPWHLHKTVFHVPAESPNTINLLLLFPLSSSLFFLLLLLFPLAPSSSSCSCSCLPITAQTAFSSAYFCQWKCIPVTLTICQKTSLKL